MTTCILFRLARVLHQAHSSFLACQFLNKDLSTFCLSNQKNTNQTSNIQRASRNIPSMSKICYIQSSQDPAKIIDLPHDQPVIIGRSSVADVYDECVSRKHLELTADTTNEIVRLRTIGMNYSGANGYALLKDNVYMLKDGDRIEVRLGFHEYVIHFESKNDGEPPVKKLKLNDVTSFSSSSSSSASSNSGSKWEEIENKALLIYTAENCTAREIIAGFDLDGTLIKTKSGARFPKDSKDWEFFHTDVPQKLRKLFEENCKVVIFTNQLGLENNSAKISSFKTKVEAVVRKVGIPMQVFVSTTRGLYRKPVLGMWHCLVQKNKISIDLTKSFYVGDAAGRLKDWAPKKNKDHSIADRLFALNIGIKFHTPEEYFFKHSQVKFSMPDFDPRTISSGQYPDLTSPAIKKEVIIMVGGPASGKTFYCKEKLIPKGYVHINRDTLKTWQKCVKVLEEHLQKGEAKAVIDNTNSDKESRRRYIDVAKEYNVDVRCFVMNTSFEQLKHNNKFRLLTDKNHQVVSDVILHSHKKQYQEPELSEGFTEITKISFVPKFDNKEHERLYKMFLLEK